MAYKVFTNGSVLQASEVNDNLMKQAVATFSNAAARTAAITSPVEGQMTWLEDVNSYQFWNGTAWVSAAIGTGSGLVHIKTVSGSAVSAINLDNVFNSSFKSYLIKSDFILSGAVQFSFRLRNGGSNLSTGVYYWNIAYMGSGATTITGANGSASTAADLFGGTRSSNINLNVLNPFEAQYKTFHAISGQGNTTPSSSLMLQAGMVNNNTSHDGISFFPASGTITGSFSVYGYKD